jgi:predicted DNA-binding transcriptional regulator AlpA
MKGNFAEDLQNRMSKTEVYTVAEVAAMTGFSRQTITRMFEREPGVIVIQRPETMHKRRHRTIRIPRPVYVRVIRKITI